MKIIEHKIQQLENQIKESKINKQKELLLTEMKKIGIEKLPYSYSALKPFIDAETMDFHYNKHYKGYVDKLNDALSKKKHGDLDLEKIIKNISRYDKAIRNNAGGAFNHALFWNMLTPNPKKLTGDLYKKITKQFVTFTNFKKKFETVAKDRFGSGWVWLVLTKKGDLKIMSTPNQDNPLMNVIEGGGFPLLGLDLWEHAYYLKYKNKRDEYIQNFWKVVNWDFVSKLFEMKTETKLLESKSRRLVTEQSMSVPFIQACTRTEEQFFESLLRSGKIGLIYGSAIKNALKSIPWLEYREKDLSINRMQGFYKDGVRHNLSYLGGNFRAFCLITKSINKLLRQTGEKPIMLRNKSLPEQESGIRRLGQIIVREANSIFEEGTPFYEAIMSNLGQSIEKGSKVENLSEERLKNEFGEDSVTIYSQFGGQSDSEGLDGSVVINGETYTIQIKPFSTYFLEDEKIVVLTTSTIKTYPQQLMVFTNQFRTLVFSNANIEEGIQAYKFPPEDLLYTIT